MATHSSVLAWRIPGTEEPSGLPSMVAQSWTRLSDLAAAAFVLSLPCGLAGKESACNVGDPGLIPALGRSPGEGKDCPLQYSGLESDTTE